MDITLDKEKGINPILVNCPCGEPINEILLLGDHKYSAECTHCNKTIIGVTDSSLCPHCKHRSLTNHREITRSVVTGQLCPKCEAEKQEFREEVIAGGLYFECRCGTSGVIKRDTELAKHARKQYPEHDGKPFGIRLEHCPACER